MTERLLFEQAGPTNGSMMPFIVEVGRIAEWTAGIIFVTPETYESVFALGKRTGEASPQGPGEIGTFRVTSFFENERPSEVYIINSDDMTSVMRRLRQMFLNQHQRAPDWLASVA